MTSSTKPEAHKISQRRQKETEPPPQATCTENLVKLGRVVHGYARGQTYTHTHIRGINPITYQRQLHARCVSVTLYSNSFLGFRRIAYDSLSASRKYSYWAHSLPYYAELKFWPLTAEEETSQENDAATWF